MYFYKNRIIFGLFLLCSMPILAAANDVHTSETECLQQNGGPVYSCSSSVEQCTFTGCMPAMDSQEDPKHSPSFESLFNLENHLNRVEVERDNLFPLRFPETNQPSVIELQVDPVDLTNPETIEKNLDIVLKWCLHPRYPGQLGFKTWDGMKSFSNLGDLFVRRDHEGRVVSSFYRQPDGSWNPKLVRYIDDLTDRIHHATGMSLERYLPPGLLMTDIYRPGDAILTENIHGNLKKTVDSMLENERLERKQRQEFLEENYPASNLKWNGAFVQKYLDDLEGKISFVIKDRKVDEVLKQLRELKTAASLLPDGIPAKRQLDKLYTQFVDERGLVREWLNGVNSLEGFQFQTPISDERGQFLRNLVNTALHNPQNSNAKLALDLLIDADAYAMSQDFQLHARRLADQAASLLRNPAHTFFVINPLREKLIAEKEFGVEILTDSFIGREIIQLSAEMSRGVYPISPNEGVAHLILVGAVRSAVDYELRGDLRRAFQQINQAYAVLDFAKGMTKGVVCFVRDSVVDAVHLALHPIDSVEAIAFALINYDKTWQIIYDGVKNTFQNFDQLSTEEKGELIAKVTATLLSTVIPIGSLKNLGKLANLEKGVGVAAAEITQKAIYIAKQLDNLLKPNGELIGKVVAGANQKIRTVSSEQFSHIKGELMKMNPKPGTRLNYDGDWYDLPGGSGFGIRPSKRHGETLDFKIPGYPKGFKVHQK